jgi:hypothetical protein
MPMSTGDQSASEGSIVAGRDVIIGEKPLPKRFAEQLEALSQRINELFPQHIISPTRGNLVEPFSAEKLIRSLVQIGIPVTAAISVAQSLEPYLVELVSDEEPLTTAHIRKAVSRAIYALTSDAHDAAQTRQWGDVYARRYGNPNGRLRLLHRDGSQEDLDYRALKTVIIPHLIRNILHKDFASLKQSFISARAVEDMANELMQQIKGLNLYAIRYKTLYNLAYDLAVQPPHPWFVESAYMSDTVTYNLERAAAHANTLPTLFEGGNGSSCRHAAQECIEHSCAAILAFYGAFLGSGYMGPIHQLIQALELPEDGNETLWEFCRIRQIEGDLAGIGESSSDLRQSLSRLARNLKGTADNKIEIVARNALSLHHLTNRLIQSRIHQADAMMAPLTIKDATGGTAVLSEAIMTVTREIFRRIPGIKLAKSQWSSEGLTLQQNLNNALFRSMRPRLLVTHMLTTDVSGSELEDHLIRLIAVADEDPNCNSIIVICHGVWSPECARTARRLGQRQFHIFLITVADLIAVYDHGDRAAALSELLLNA